MNAAVKRLTRSDRDRVFGGVCGGLADYLGQDAVLVRVGFVALTLLSGVVGGILLYLFSWAIIPLGEHEGMVPNENVNHRGRTSRIIIGLLICVAGLLALGVSFLPPFWHVSDWRVAGPLTLVIVGILILLWHRDSNIKQKESAMNGSAQEQTHTSEAGQETHRPRRLYRRHQGRKIAGVAAGLGEYFNVDPTIIRIIFLTLLFVGGTGLFLYLVMWIAMPLET